MGLVGMVYGYLIISISSFTNKQTQCGGLLNKGVNCFRMAGWMFCAWISGCFYDLRYNAGSLISGDFFIAIPVMIFLCN